MIALNLDHAITHRAAASAAFLELFGEVFER